MVASPLPILATDVSVEEVASLEPVEKAAQGALAGEERGPVTALRSRPVASGGLVQHVGSWCCWHLRSNMGCTKSPSALRRRVDAYPAGCDARGNWPS